MHYKFVNKNTEIIDIPDELLNFLLIEQPVEKEQEVKQNHNLPNQTSNNDIYITLIHMT